MYSAGVGAQNNQQNKDNKGIQKNFLPRQSNLCLACIDTNLTSSFKSEIFSKQLARFSHNAAVSMFEHEFSDVTLHLWNTLVYMLFPSLEFTVEAVETTLVCLCVHRQDLHAVSS